MVRVGHVTTYDGDLGWRFTTGVYLKNKMFLTSCLFLTDWYIAIVCCHSFGVVLGFLAGLLTLLTVCGPDEESTKTFFAVILGSISCKWHSFQTRLMQMNSKSCGLKSHKSDGALLVRIVKFNRSTIFRL